MTGPNGSSVTTPTYSSRPRLWRAMRCTVTPFRRASGRWRCTLCIMLLNTSRTATEFSTFSATPPTSLLWLMSGESIFSATGKPIWVAVIMASLALRASTVCVTGMWNAASSAFDSTSVSTERRSDSTLSMIRRAPSRSGLASCDSGGGVCCSSWRF